VTKAVHVVVATVKRAMLFTVTPPALKNKPPTYNLFVAESKARAKTFPLVPVPKELQVEVETSNFATRFAFIPAT
jgi:hypothetical protein